MLRCCYLESDLTATYSTTPLLLPRLSCVDADLVVAVRPFIPVRYVKLYSERVIGGATMYGTTSVLVKLPPEAFDPRQ